MSERKAISQDKLTPQQAATYERLNLSDSVAASGVNNNNFMEPVPQFDKAPAETIIKNNNNAWIVLGRDRPDSITSGYGGRGFTGAAAIDLCVGRQAAIEGGPDANSIVGNNFFTDAARIYISQKTDIDRNFSLVGDTQIYGRSAIGIKADAVRVVGREGVKIVTGKAKNLEGAGSDGEKNSQGGKIDAIAGVELIAGNDTRATPLEPIAKSYALNEVLVKIVDRLDELTDIVNDMAKLQTQINTAIQTHTHAGVMPGPSVTAPPVDLALTIATKEASKMSNVHQNLYKQKLKTKVSLRETYLDPSAKKWFGSRFNKTN